MNPDLQTFGPALIEAVLNGGVQGLFLTVLVLLALRILPRTSAATRHAVCFATLAMVALLPIAHLGRAYWLMQTNGAQTVAEGEPIVITTVKVEPIAEPVPLSEIDWRPMDEVPAGTFRATPSLPFPVQEIAIPLAVPRQMLLVLLAGWGLLATIRLGALAWQLKELRSIRKNAKMPAPQLQERFDRLSEPIPRRAVLLISERNINPMAIGFGRPAVVIPEALANTKENEDLDAVLRHELAHLGRRDDWTVLAQQLAAALLFFHPAVWVLMRRINIEREIACDDHVLAATRSRRDYALALTRFASQSAARRWTAAPAAWGSNSQIKRRINMILDKKRNSAPRCARATVGMITGSALAAALLGMAAAPQLALAQDVSASSSGSVSIWEDASDDSAPRIKAAILPHALPDVQVEAQISAAPAPAAAPVVEVHAAPVGLVVAPTPPRIVAAHPVPPRSEEESRLPRATAPRSGAASRAPARREDSSIENRIERLERMIEELASREKGKDKNKELSGLELHMKGPQVHPPDVRFDKDFHFQIKRDAEWFARDAERKVKDLEVRSKDFEKLAELHAHQQVDQQKIQRQALQAERKALEKQLESIERRLKEIERQEERTERQREQADRARELAERQKEQAQRRKDQAEREKESRAKKRVEADHEEKPDQRKF